MRDDKDFYDRIQELRERPILKARRTVEQSLNTPEGARWYLERKKKLEFSTRSEHTGADGKDLIPDPLTDQEKLKLKGLLNDTTGTG